MSNGKYEQFQVQKKNKNQPIVPLHNDDGRIEKRKIC